MENILTIKNTLEAAIAQILQKLGVKDPKVSLEHPDNLSFGDFATSVALAYSKELKEKPFTLAGTIVENLKKSNIAHVEDISLAGPGFINIKLDRTFFSEFLKHILTAGEIFSVNTAHAQARASKVIIEYTNTNVLKPLHIGHLMGNILGESLSRLYERAGYQLKRATYEGDVGLHVAKALWGIKALDFEKPKSDATLSEKSVFIGKAYALGASAYEDDPKAAEAIKVINKAIFEGTDASLKELYVWGRQASLDHFETLYKKLGTRFDYYFFESEVAKDAIAIVKDFLAKGIFEESEGAVVFRGERFNPKLHTRVFINSQGLPTYEAKDIAHALRKYKTFEADKSIIVTASEQNDYFSVVLAALKEIAPEVASKTFHLSHGMLRLPSGKMSSRSGNVITGESLLDELYERVLEKIKDRGFDVEEASSVASAVSVGAIKYSILKQSPGSDIVFDFEKAISFEGDSGPYLQYTAVRAGSILRKATDVGLSPKASLVPPEISDLEKMMYRFKEIAMRSLEESAPNHLAAFLVSLASLFNSWYGSTKIIDEKDPYSPYRLALTSGLKKILEEGLYLLGIAVPEKM